MTTYKDIYNMIMQYSAEAWRVICECHNCITCKRHSWCYCDTSMLAADYIERGDY